VTVGAASKKPWGLGWEAAAFLVLLLYPVFPAFEGGFFAVTGRSLGDQLPTVFIFAVLALGLNVVVGYTGILHLGIAAFFAIGAYAAGILTVASYPFGANFVVSLVVGTVAAAVAGLLLGAPTLRLRGDYLALVTLGFGEVVKVFLKNAEEITAGTRGLSPVPPPTENLRWLDWTSDYRPFYYLTLGFLIAAYLFLRNVERSRLGRAWVALREDELAANCTGLNPAKLKLAAFALGAGLAGLAGVLYATRLTSTSDPNAYDFNRSIFLICCLILGGLGSRPGVLLGVFLLVGFDNIFSPIIDSYIQEKVPGAGEKVYLTFTGWRLMVFGLALIVMMRVRPEGIIPSVRVKHELHPDEVVTGTVEPTTMYRSGETPAANRPNGGPE
jgi:branched-chain amino acid transport system permease protein